MTRTYILVDFENVQPSAADIRRVQGESLRLWIFRGPGQKKYSAEVAEAWQPLGDRVHFVACAKAGRNAVDMHVALEIGRLIGEAATGKGTRFVVVSKDTDFEPLLMHVRNLGYAATRATTLKAALEVGGAEKAEARAAKAKPPAKKASKQVAKKAAVKKTTVKKAAAKAPVSKPPASPLPAARGAIDARAKVIESLHRMGEKRPAKRKGLERHIESHLGRKLAPGAVAEIVAELEREGVLKFSDKRVEYALPKARK